MGSTVVRGEVEGTVEFTGAETFFGKTASLLVVRKYVRVFLCVFIAMCSRLFIFLICCVCVWGVCVCVHVRVLEYSDTHSLLHSLIQSGCVTTVQFACSFSLLLTHNCNVSYGNEISSRILSRTSSGVHAISHSAQSYHSSEGNDENGLYMTLARW